MRVGEALRLDCGDLDWDQAVIKVAAKAPHRHQPLGRGGARGVQTGVEHERHRAGQRDEAGTLSAIDPRTEVPPAGLVSYRPSRRVPYLFSDQDVAAVVRAARASTPSAFRAETLASLIVLLAVTPR